MGDTDVDTKSVSGTLHSTKRSQCQHRVYDAATLLRHEHTANRVFRRVAGLLTSGSRPEAMVVWGVARSAEHVPRTDQERKGSSYTC